MRTAQASRTLSANRSLILIAVVIAILLAGTAGVVALAGNRAPHQYAANSPQGVLQRYLASFDEGDYEAAYARFSDGVQDRMTLAQYERAIDDYGIHGGEGPARRVFFDRVTGSGDRVQVHVVVEEFYGDGLNANTFRSERQVRAIRQPNGWHIDEPLVWLDPAPLFDVAP
jgi:hypothetical protein